MTKSIDIKDELLKEAFLYTKDITSEKDLLELALTEFIRIRKGKKLSELRGQIAFRDDYDYKALREGI